MKTGFRGIKFSAIVLGVLLLAGIVMAAGEELKLGLVDCIEAALANNRDIMLERMNLRQSKGEVEKAWGTFDPIASAQTTYAHAEQPAGTQLLGANVSEQERVTWDMGLQMLVPSGTLMRLDFQNERSESNSVFQDLNPQYETSVTFTVTQPLLKGFGFTPGLYRVRLARNNLAVSELELQNVVLNTVSTVETSYWNLVLAHENLRVATLSRELARQILKMTDTQVNIGVLAPVAMLQAEAAVAAREEGVILAENAIRTAQRELLRVINAYDKYEEYSVIPVDRPAAVQPPPDPGKVRVEAMRNNFQLRQLQYQADNLTLTRKVARNSMLPQLNIMGSVGVVGIAGDAIPPTTQVVETGRVIPDPSGASVGILETTTYAGQKNAFDGTYVDAFNDMTSGDYVTWTVGMQIEYPLGNRSARKDYSRAIIEEKKAAVQLERARELIRMMIDNLIGELDTAIKRVDATTKSAELALKNMEAEEKKFKVGINTNRDVLETQESYARALTAQVQALIDYNKVRGRIERARMGYLDLGISGYSSGGQATYTASSQQSTAATASQMVPVTGISSPLTTGILP